MWVDPVAPKATLERQGDLLVAHGEDLGSDAANLEYAWRVDDEEFGDFSRVSIRSLEEFEGARRVSVIVLDEAGNVSTPRTIDLSQRDAAGGFFAPSTRVARVDAPSPMAGGCSQTSPTTSALWGLLAAFGAVWIRRRRRER